MFFLKVMEIVFRGYATLLSSFVPLELRLVDGPTRCAGRLEIYHNKQWGTVCDADWDLNDANVVCRELECGTALKATGGAQFGEGSGVIWLDRVNCTGKEAFLNECPKRPWGEHSCDHSRDASVECSGNLISYVGISNTD